MGLRFVRWEFSAGRWTDFAPGPKSVSVVGGTGKPVLMARRCVDGVRPLSERSGVR